LPATFKGSKVQCLIACGVQGFKSSKVKGSIACGVQGFKSSKVKLPAAFKGSIAFGLQYSMFDI
jgi:hypothetical protein